MPRYSGKELRLEAAHLRRKAADILEQSGVILERSRQLKKASQQRINAPPKARRGTAGGPQYERN